MRNNIISNLYIELKKVSESYTPRILTQICRDKNSENYGCADRNWWHYKMRDFPSIILQQSGLSVFELLKFNTLYQNTNLEPLAKASFNFWNKRAKKFRAFEEYYPWEEGYPPLAFSTLAAAISIKNDFINYKDISSGIKIAAKQLIERFEAKAANQQVAGLAALCTIRHINPKLVPEKEYKFLKKKTLNLQDEEGWFQEYDGPDLGYLSVTIDCLWDAYDATLDHDFVVSGEKAIFFIDKMINNLNSGSIGLHNSRNTDYIVPYGISRFLGSEKTEVRNAALRIMVKIFQGASNHDHFLSAIDDRYINHYIGLSLFRSVNFLKTINIHSCNLVLNEYKDFSFHNCGIYWITNKENNCRVLISGRKGGNVSIYAHDKKGSDFGWIVSMPKLQLISNWWSNDWEINIKNNVFSIHGNLFPHKELQSSPLKHLILRLSSLLLGHRLINFLKRQIIFKSTKTKITFNRKIKILKKSIQLEDTFFGLTDNANLSRPSRQSKRHVASADSYHYEDLNLHQYEFSERKEFSQQGVLKVFTEYGIKETNSI